MLILFVAASGGSGGAAPALPDLHIQDSQNGTHVPVGGFEGWDSDYIQVQGICKAPLDLQTPETGKTAGDTTVKYWTRRLSTVVVKVNFSDSGASATIRPLLYEKDDVELVGASLSFSALTRTESGKYMSQLQTFDTLGANKVALLVETVSAGTIDISLAGV